MAQFVITSEAYENLPPSSVGNNSITIGYASVHVFTVANFTTETSPVYTDPENNPAAQLKILTLPAVGTLKLNNVAVNANDIIEFSDIALNKFTYESDASDTDGYSASFTFQIADSGSGIFVS